MKMKEYEEVKGLNYREYCEYLQKKYGIGLSNYMTSSWCRVPRCTRTKEGLFIHHVFEDHAVQLSEKEYAMQNPFEWQEAKNLVYCDYLEHLFLHILICEYPAEDKVPGQLVGVGGVINHLVPQLNDYYAGLEPSQVWRMNCWNRVKDEKDVYFVLLKRFNEFIKKESKYKGLLFHWWESSESANYGFGFPEKSDSFFREVRWSLK